MGKVGKFLSMRMMKPKSGVEVVVLLLLLMLLVDAISMLLAMFLPKVNAAREAGRRAKCTDNLARIAQAMRDHHDVHNCFPAAVTTDAQGNPMRSWRIAVTPFLEKAELFESYNFDEPWDSPINLPLEHARPTPYACPSDPLAGPCSTSYVMIVGMGTVGGEANEFISVSDIPDGPANTIMAIDVAGSGISWLEPRDMNVDEAIAYITAASGRHPGGVDAAFADGSVHFISSQIDPQLLEYLLTRDDGQELQAWQSRLRSHHE